MRRIIIALLILALPTAKSYSEIRGNDSSREKPSGTFSQGTQGRYSENRYCFDESSQRYGIHPTLLWAIAKVESNFHPYAIGYRKNGENITIYPDSVDLARQWIDWLWQNGLDFDLGVGQINRGNIISYRINPYHLLDPCYNLYWSAYILRTMIDRFGYSWEGISHYNGGGLSYSRKVWKVIEGLKIDKTKSGDVARKKFK